jgi:DNA-directed RNA polymerase specialized sigma24 family protein
LAAIGAEALERYEAALSQLDENDRALVPSRIEMGLNYAEVAAATHRPTADAARMAVGRLARAMSDER